MRGKNPIITLRSMFGEEKNQILFSQYGVCYWIMGFFRIKNEPRCVTGFAFWAARVAGQRWIRKPMANETPGGTFKRTGYRLHTFLMVFYNKN